MRWVLYCVGSDIACMLCLTNRQGWSATLPGRQETTQLLQNMAEEYVMLRGKTQDLLKDYGNVLHDLLNAPPGQTPTHGQQLVDESLSAFLASYYGIQSRFNDHALSVGLLALTKSGETANLSAQHS